MNNLARIINSKKLLYLPVEISSRELHSKIFLAHTAISKGWTVILGPRFEVSKLAEILPAGAYLGIGFHKSASKIAEKLSDLGHKVLSSDEEGLVRLAPKYYREFRIDKSIFEYSEKILLWSRSHLKVVGAIAGENNNLEIIGNPRLDILMPTVRDIFTKQAMQIKQAFGDFILINTNFGSANHTLGINYWKGELRKRGWFDTSEKEEYQNKRIDFQEHIFQQMQKLSVLLAKQRIKVVIRPHPSESLDSWKCLQEQFPEYISIERNGNIIPWMLASSAIVHNGCTTAIEGRLLDKLIITYRPLKEPIVEADLPNSVGVEFNEPETLLKFISQLELAHYEFDHSILPSLNMAEIIQGTIEDNFSTRFVKLIEDFSFEPSSLSHLKILDYFLKIWIVRCKLFLGGLKNRTSRRYELQKCTSVSKAEVKEVLDILMSDANTPSQLRIDKVGKRSLCLQKV